MFYLRGEIRPAANTKIERHVTWTILLLPSTGKDLILTLNIPMPTLLTTESARELVELRRSRRFPLSAAVFFSWVDRDGTLRDRSGTARDVSMAGAFIVADMVPHLGAPVAVDIYLPVDVSGRIVELHGEGKVARVESSGQIGSGFAAEVMFQTRSSDNATGLGPHGAQ